MKKIIKVIAILLMYVLLIASIGIGVLSILTTKQSPTYIKDVRPMLYEGEDLLPQVKAKSLLWLKEAGPTEWAGVKPGDLVFFSMPKSESYLAGYIKTEKDAAGYVRVGASDQSADSYTVKIKTTDITEIPQGIWNIPSPIYYLITSDVGHMLICAYILFALIMTGVLIGKKYF